MGDRLFHTLTALRHGCRLHSMLCESGAEWSAIRFGEKRFWSVNMYGDGQSRSWRAFVTVSLSWRGLRLIDGDGSLDTHTF